MIISSNVFLKQLVIHKINAQSVRISKDAFSVQDDFLKQVLTNYFFHSFKDDERYCFDLLDSNHVNEIVSKIFENPENSIYKKNRNN